MRALLAAAALAGLAGCVTPAQTAWGEQARMQCRLMEDSGRRADCYRNVEAQERQQAEQQTQGQTQGQTAPH